MLKPTWIKSEIKIDIEKWGKEISQYPDLHKVEEAIKKKPSYLQEEILDLAEYIKNPRSFREFRFH